MIILVVADKNKQEFRSPQITYTHTHARAHTRDTHTHTHTHARTHTHTHAHTRTHTPHYPCHYPQAISVVSMSGMREEKERVSE